jgi:hypothetical protein
MIGSDARLLASAPPKRRSDVGEYCFDRMSVIGHAQLVGHGQQQGVGFADGFVLT